MLHRVSQIGWGNEGSERGVGDNQNSLCTVLCRAVLPCLASMLEHTLSTPLANAGLSELEARRLFCMCVFAACSRASVVQKVPAHLLSLGRLYWSGLRVQRDLLSRASGLIEGGGLTLRVDFRREAVVRRDRSLVIKERSGRALEVRAWGGRTLEVRAWNGQALEVRAWSRHALKIRAWSGHALEVWALEVRAHGGQTLGVRARSGQALEGRGRGGQALGAVVGIRAVGSSASRLAVEKPTGLSLFFLPHKVFQSLTPGGGIVGWKASHN